MAHPPEHIHVATLIRLNVATTALELAASDLSALIADMPRGDAGRREGYTTTLALVRAALDIARGARSDVPPSLRDRSTLGIMHDTAAIERFLTLGQES